MWKLLLIMTNCVGFDFCGNYCGPNWCSGIVIPEKKCFEKITNYREPVDNVDNCCFEHDMCCGNTVTRSKKCNKELLSCLKKYSGLEDDLMILVFSELQNKVCGEI